MVKQGEFMPRRIWQILSCLFLSQLLLLAPLEAQPWEYPLEFEAFFDLNVRQQLAVAALGNRAVLLSWQQQTPLYWLRHPGKVVAARFSADGQQLAVVSQAEELEIFWWDLKQRRLLGHWDWIDAESLENKLNQYNPFWQGQLDFKPDASQLVAASSSRVCAYSTDTEPQCQSLKALQKYAPLQQASAGEQREQNNKLTALHVNDSGSWLLFNDSCCVPGIYWLWRWDHPNSPELVGQSAPRSLQDTWWELSDTAVIEYQPGHYRKLSLPLLEPQPWIKAELDETRLDTSSGTSRLFVNQQNLLEPGPPARLWQQTDAHHARLTHRFEALAALQQQDDFVLFEDLKHQRFEIWQLSQPPKASSLSWRIYHEPSYERDNRVFLAYPQGFISSLNNEFFFWPRQLRFSSKAAAPSQPQPRRVLLPRDNEPLKACLMPGGKKILGISYQDIPNIREPDAPTYDQYDTQRRLFLLDPVNALSTPFANHSLDEQLPEYRAYHKELFSPDCHSLALIHQRELKLLDLHSLRTRKLKASLDQLKAFSPDGNWLLGSFKTANSDQNQAVLHLASGKRFPLPSSPALISNQNLVSLIEPDRQQNPKLAVSTLNPRGLKPLKTLDLGKHWQDLSLQALSDNGRWLLLSAKLLEEGHAVSRLYLADTQTGQFKALTASLKDKLGAFDQSQGVGIASKNQHSWAWKLSGTRLLRWEIPSGKALPALKSHAAFELKKVLPDPLSAAWMALDASGQLHRLTEEHASLPRN